MFTTTLSDRELETLILALKYWRGRRHGATRRSDHLLTRVELDLLLAKLGAGTLSTLPANDSADLFRAD